MDTPAQKRAKNNYQKKVKVFRLQFYPNNENDTAMYKHLKAQTNTTQYLKRLIKQDMQ